MNKFQWNLRYPPSVEVNGYHSPEAAGGLDYSTNGPWSVPGTYTVVLDYGGEKSRQTFAIALGSAASCDRRRTWPRVWRLTQQIQADMNALNGEVNAAIAAARSSKRQSPRTASPRPRRAGALDALNSLIDSDVQMKIRSSEGDTMQEVKLHALSGIPGGGRRGRLCASYRGPVRCLPRTRQANESRRAKTQSRCLPGRQSGPIGARRSLRCAAAIPAVAAASESSDQTPAASST